MRVSFRAKFFGLVILGVICGAGALACAGGDDDSPRWALVTREYDSFGSSAVLTPGNDTRVNLLLLVADRGPAGGLRSPDKSKPNALFNWDELFAHTRPASHAKSEGESQPESGEYHWFEPSRCQSNSTGATAFIQAVRASPNVSEAEKTKLVASRQALDPWAQSAEQSWKITCGETGIPKQLPAVQSTSGREFGRYIDAAAAFYRGNFEEASAQFAALAAGTEPWVRETALYMAARTKLNAAQQFGEYGDLPEPGKRDQAAIAAAGTAFNSYLHAYPDGRYAGSARGLLRRVAWLAGDTRDLTGTYTRLLDGRAEGGNLHSAADLAQEIDIKLFADLGGGEVSGPVLLAVADLMRMRKVDAESACTGSMSWCFKPITKAEIEAQRARFGSDTELYDYIRAAEAFFVRHQPREVLQIIPDATHQVRFTYLQYSRQMLRGFALDALGDHNARGFLLDLFGGAIQPFQRDALELQLAIHDERSGNLPLIFAPGSRVRNPFIREILLERIAGPELLRQQAKSGQSENERGTALYILLAKELRHGLYSEFLTDVRLVPAGARTDGYFRGADEASEFPPGVAIPLGIFTRPTGVGDFGCPALTETVSALARAANDIRARLCLGEFMREGAENSLDPFPYDEPITRPYRPEATGGLATTRPLFPGPAFLRLDVYKSIIADRGATPDETAFALNRAIRCYAPSSYNGCGGAEVGLPQRRAWFGRLKNDYSQSRWAKSLKYYW